MAKSGKELAFLFDLYVATDWGERFAEFLDAHVELPKDGRVLYIAAGTGAHALALAGRMGGEASVTAIDESEERIWLAQAKQSAVSKESAAIAFRRMQADALDFEDESFDMVIADASLLTVERLPEVLSEMARVVALDGRVALAAATHSSFGEFYSVLWEALSACDYVEQAAGVEELISESPLVSKLEDLIARAGLEHIQSWTQREEFEFASGEEFLTAPLVADFLLPEWYESVALEHAQRECVEDELTRIIDEERNGAEFILSIKATVVVARPQL